MRLFRFTPLAAMTAGLLLCMLPSVSHAQAVVDNSTFDAYVFSSAFTSGSTFTFNGSPQTLSTPDGNITVNESQSSLGSGQYQVDFTFTSNFDMFPVAGDNGFVNLGGFSDPVQLTGAYDVTSAILTYKNGSGGTIASGDVSGAITNNNPWDGYFPASGVGEGYVGIGGDDTQEIDVNLTLGPAPVPEASTFASFGGLLGMGSLAALRRRKLMRA